MKMNYAALSKLNEMLLRLSSVTGRQGLVIAKNLQALKPHMEIYNDMRMKLFEKYGEQDDNGNLTVKENVEDFKKEVVQLISENVDVDLFKVKESDFNIDALYTDTARASDYQTFEFLMVEHEDENKDGDIEKK